MAPQLDPYARLSLRDRMELLAFEARLAGFPRSLIQAVWEARDAFFMADPSSASRISQYRRRSGAYLFNRKDWRIPRGQRDGLRGDRKHCLSAS